MSETPDTTAAPKAAAAIPADSDILLKADSLIAGYLPGINILNGCNLYVAPDELIGIIGPNGAGKSTLLKSLFGLVKVHEGSVTLRGENITNLKADQLVTKASGSSRRRTTSSPASPSRRTWRWASSRRPSATASGSTSSSTCSRCSASAASSGPARSPAVSGRWWRWAAR